MKSVKNKLAIIDGESMSIAHFRNLTDNAVKWHIPDANKQKIISSRKIFEVISQNNTPIYGVTTGFGEMVYMSVDASKEEELQTNLVRSHAAGVGPYFSQLECKSILLARTNALVKGYSAVRENVVNRLLFMLNNNIIPAIPEIGSLGASGDLAPLAHMALPLIGEGELFDENGTVVSANKILKKWNITPMKLYFKEGLALINGTSAMTGLSCLILNSALDQIKEAEIITALSLEVLGASMGAFAEDGHKRAKPHKGQIDCALNLRALLSSSSMVKSHKQLEKEIARKLNDHQNVTKTNTYIQKAYTLRCIPQILGAVRDNIYHSIRVTEIELNSANDNPLFFGKDHIFHGGNFHGQPIAFCLDTVAMVLTQIGVVSERRLNRLLNRHLSNGLPEFLVINEPGLNCGFAGAQYPATALVAENRSLCHPASIQSVPSNGDNQDVVSMGLISGRKARRILNNNWYILALEALSAAQAVDIKSCYPKLSESGKATYDFVRTFVSPLVKDRYMRNDIEIIANELKIGSLLNCCPVHLV
ncbi:MAG: tyrosine 2,3-aminomutase [Lewinellaceae bacterium]|nr:tyrosine 2,3-aminomutase [Lewinellaceae bacterium]